MIRTQFLRDWLALQSVGSTMDNLDTSILGDLPIVCPEPAEQIAISAFIVEECQRIDELVCEADKALVLLAERRSALISAAVTGKIDVRDIAPDLTEAA